MVGLATRTRSHDGTINPADTVLASNSPTLLLSRRTTHAEERAAGLPCCTGDQRRWFAFALSHKTSHPSTDTPTISISVSYQNMSETNPTNANNAAPAAANNVVSPRVDLPTDDDNLPSRLLCPLLVNEPPVRGVTFEVPTASGIVSSQIFEYSEIFRHIYTLGRGQAFRHVAHPITRASILRSSALSFVRDVSVDT